MIYVNALYANNSQKKESRMAAVYFSMCYVLNEFCMVSYSGCMPFMTESLWEILIQTHMNMCVISLRIDSLPDPRYHLLYCRLLTVHFPPYSPETAWA